MWFYALAAMVFVMVVIGGITRLTRSGLSITEWRPVTGTLPPLNQSAWEREFGLYRATPEYRLVNRGMSLSEFKRIYFWEYLHRLWGRLIGLAFLLPFLYFLLRRRLDRRLLLLSLGAFVLGGAQGALGWFMVKSGLVAEPRVSQYRLAAHLTLALFVMQYLYWLGYRLRGRDADPVAPRAVLGAGVCVMLLLSLQILWGALVAGLRAGHLYNTYPLMGENYIPGGLFTLQPLWKNFFENAATTQFVHRWLAVLVALSVGAWWWLGRRLRLAPGQQRALQLVALLVAVQFLLGVLTLLYFVPISLGVLHQAGAALLLTGVTHALLRLRPGPTLGPGNT